MTERDSAPEHFRLAMMKRNHTSLCTSAAIAAALALGSTPVAAQAVDVSVAAPAPIAAPPPAPVAAQPQIIMVPSEVVQATPPPTAAPVDEPVATTTRPAATTRRAPAAAPMRTTVADTPVAVPASEPEAAAPVVTESAAIEPLSPLAAAPEPMQPAWAQDTSGALLATLLGGIAVLALAIWGFVAIGRRRTLPRRVAVPIIERPVVAKREPVAEPQNEVSTWDIPRPAAPAASLAHSGAAVALPRAVPQTFAERDALLKRMIAANPDRANPFVGYKARLRRARLILQSLGRDFGETKPWIDLSQYSANWPEFARSNTAAA